MIRQSRTSRWIVAACVVITGVSMLVFGFWAWLAPSSFADFAAFPHNEHFLHDAGVFQIGIGAGLLVALLWADAIAVVLSGFLTANTLHAFNHATDLRLGGHVADAWELGAFSAVAAIALYLRVRQLRRVRQVRRVRAARSTES